MKQFSHGTEYCTFLEEELTCIRTRILYR